MVKRKISNKLPPFVALTWKMLRSTAYRELPPSSAKLLPFFIGKVKYIPFQDPDRYRTPFDFRYSEAEKTHGFGRSTFYKVITDLMKFGFIDPVKKGGLRSFGNTSSKFKLSQRWELYGTNAFTEVNWKCFLNHSQVTKMDSTVPLSERVGVR